MIKKTYLFLCLILFSVSQDSLCMQANLNDAKYLELKQDLKIDVEDSNYDNVQTTLSTFDEYIKNKFITDYNNEKQIATYKKESAKYIQDLLYQPLNNSIIDASVNKKNLDIIYLLLNFAGSGTENNFYNFLNLRLTIDPMTDQTYLNEKKKLIELINNGQIINPSEIIFDLHRTIFDKFVIQTKDKDLLSSRYFNGTIWPKYEEDLYPDLITASISKKATEIIYVLLNSLPRPLFIQFILNKQPFISDLLKIKDQPIYDALNYILTLNINTLMKKQYLSLLNFLNHLKELGITTERLEHIIIKLFAALDISNDDEWIKQMKKDKFIVNFDEKSYEQYLLRSNIAKALNSLQFNTASKLATQIDQSFINDKDIHGNSLLINAIMQDLTNKKAIKLIKNLIDNKAAEINQPGQGGLTPLMWSVKTRFLKENQQIELVKYLIDKGADLGAKDIFGKTALDYARGTHKPQELIDVLIKHSPISTQPVVMSIQDQIMALNNLSSTLQALTNRA